MFSAKALFAAACAAITSMDAAAVASGENVCSDDPSSPGCDQNDAEEQGSEVWSLLQTSREPKGLGLGQERVEHKQKQTPMRLMELECADLDNGATDYHGNTCAAYIGNTSLCGLANSNDICCACGGGQDINCADTDNGATNDWGESCSVYVGNSGSCGYNDVTDGGRDGNAPNFISDEMCCGCGGGLDIRCADADNGATDYNSDSCSAYIGNTERCGYYDYDYDFGRGFFNADEMCCACGGGQAATPPR